MTDLSKLRIEREPEVKEHKRGTAWILLALISLAVAIAGYFLWAGPLQPATKVKATTVNAIYASQANSVLNASGYVVAQRQADVASKATGRLEVLLVEEGSVVKKGQVIARLESKDVEANLAQSGWTIRSAPPGFRKIMEMTRTLGGRPGVGHIVFSDGLAAVSVFIEPAKSSGAHTPGLAHQGIINVYTRQLADHWITVLGETPAESVRLIANAVEYRKPR